MADITKLGTSFTSSCSPVYDTNVVDPYARSCGLLSPASPTLPDIFDYKLYLRAKNRANKNISIELINTFGIASEKRHEGFISGWLLQREVGWEETSSFALFQGKHQRFLSSDNLIDTAIRFFEHPVQPSDPERTAVKGNYWRIKLPLILLEDVDTEELKKFFRRHEGFFGFKIGKGKRKEEILKILKYLEKKLANMGNPDPALVAEVKFRIGILLNEMGNFAEAKKYFAQAFAAANDIAKDPARYRANHINNRVDIIQNFAVISDLGGNSYYQTAELNRVLSSVYKIMAQSLLLQTYGERDISMDQLKTALDHTRQAYEYLQKNIPGGGSVYKYNGENYSLLDLERLRADILGRMGLLLKDSCPAQSGEYIKQAMNILQKIIDWEKQFVADRAAIRGNRPYKLHPLSDKVEGTGRGKPIALLSEWGADIVGSAYLTQARLLMSIYPPPNDPKANLKKAGELLLQARIYLVKKDDDSYNSALAEYLVQMDIDSAPRDLTDNIKKAMKLLQDLPEGFIYSKLWMVRILMKQEKFREAKIVLDQIKKQNKSVLTPQLKSSIYQTYAELALEDEDLLEAQNYFSQAICWNPYNYYAQLGLADLANWRGDYAAAQQIYNLVINPPTQGSPILPVTVRERARLGMYEVALRQVTLDPGADATEAADRLIAFARRIIATSRETFMIERALESLTEAIIAKKKGGEAELEALKQSLLQTDFNVQGFMGGTGMALAKPELRERVKAGLYLKIADGFLFIHEIEKAREILLNLEVRGEKDKSHRLFESRFAALIAKKPIFKAHAWLTTAEISQRAEQNSPLALRRLFDAAKILFTLREGQRDPYLTSRAVNDLIDVCINEDKFKEALTIIFLVQKQQPKDELAKLGGLLPKSNRKPLGGDPNYRALEEMLQQIIGLVPQADLERIYRSKGLDRGANSKWSLLKQDLRLKLAEIMVWTRNFKPALELLDQLKDEIKEPEAATPTARTAQNTGFFSSFRSLQRVRIMLAYGNIETQWKRTFMREKDFRLALAFYQEAERIIRERINADYPGQELILVKTELYLNLANLYLYGQGTIDGNEPIRNLKKARAYFDLARYQAGDYHDANHSESFGIKGNHDLKHYHLARIYLGLSEIAEIEGRVELEGKIYWAPQLLDRARYFANRIRRKSNYAFDQLFRNVINVKKQMIGSGPTVTASVTAINSNQRVGRANEAQVSGRVAVPFHFENVLGLKNLDVAPVFKTNTDMNLQTGGAVQSYYLGMMVKPAYWLTAEALANLHLSHALTPYDKRLKYFTQPDITLSLEIKPPTDRAFLRGLSSTVVTDLFAGAPQLNSVYANLCYSAARDSNNPLVRGASICAQFNYFKFPYAGNGMFPERTRISFPTFRYDLDLKEFDFAERDWLAHNKLKISAEVSPIYEYARDFYSTGEKIVAMPKNNLGLSTTLSFLINTGFMKARIYYRYEGIMQDVQGLYRMNERWQSAHQFGLTLEWKF